MSSTSSSPSLLSPTPLYLPEHVVVLVHGNNGAPSDLASIETTLQQKYTADELLVINSRENHTRTSLGVDVGGEKLALEVVTTILKFDLSPKIDRYKFSIVGHSLGGLYARYAIALVQEELSMLMIDYVSFLTLCTPHLGSRRPRASSTIKNVYRLGVHTVLASKQIYGQTGVDLLVTNDATTTDATTDEGKRPVLDVMSDHDSEFITALRRFRHCTLVAMADGDMVVPFASASIRNFNPYPSVLLSKNFPSWRWHVRHAGFDNAPANLRRRLDDCVDELVEIENADAGLDVATSERFASIEGEYDSDNKREVEFTFDMIQRQQAAVAWRRIDIIVEPSGVKGKLRLHDWPVNKAQPPDCRAMEFIDLLTDVIGVDHGLNLRKLPEPPLVVEDVDVEVEDASRSSRLSFINWSAEKKPLGEQLGTLFQSVKSRFASSTSTTATNSSSVSSRDTPPSATDECLAEVEAAVAQHDGPGTQLEEAPRISHPTSHA